MTNKAKKKKKVENLVEENFKKLPLNEGSVYDYAFWLMYHEDNSSVLREIMLKCCFSILITLVLTYYYVLARADKTNDIIHYGSANLNMVRTICILMLHLQMFPDVRNSLSMMEFTLHNPEKFPHQSVVFPVLICLFKLFISMSV